MTACSPRLPTSAAAGLTLRSPALVLLDDQADRLPDSKPSAKIRSAEFGVGVFVAVGVGVFVPPAVGVGVRVGVGVFAAVGVGVRVGVAVAADWVRVISCTLPSFSFGSLLLSTARSVIYRCFSAGLTLLGPYARPDGSIWL